MDTDFRELFCLSEDVLNASTIAYEFCKEAEEERMVKIRPILEMIRNKADKLCIKLLEFEDSNA